MNTSDISIGMMILMALTLGIRHGFDLDHLATIDAITRSVKDRPLLARLTGTLFSLGHGLVVIFFCFLLGSGLIQSTTPVWLEGLGKGISIFFLIVFGVINLMNVIKRKQTTDVPIGLKALVLKFFRSKQKSARMIIFIGGLFALSFDTFSQAALFSLFASMVSHKLLSLVLGLSFTIGMILSDGINGFIVAGIIRVADKKSRYITKGFGLIISCFSLVLGINGLINLIR
jgi:high-affinity nickel permease